MEIYDDALLANKPTKILYNCTVTEESNTEFYSIDLIEGRIFPVTAIQIRRSDAKIHNRSRVKIPYNCDVEISYEIAMKYHLWD